MKETTNYKLILFLFCLLINSVIFGSNTKSDIKAKYLRCEYKENPVIDALKPRLSWILNSNQRGQVQSAYRIIVASSLDKLDEVKADLKKL